MDPAERECTTNASLGTYLPAPHHLSTRPVNCGHQQHQMAARALCRTKAENSRPNGSPCWTPVSDVRCPRGDVTIWDGSHSTILPMEGAQDRTWHILRVESVLTQDYRYLCQICLQNYKSSSPQCFSIHFLRSWTTSSVPYYAQATPN